MGKTKKAEAAAATWYSSTPVLQYKPKREERQKQVTRRNNHESQSLCQEDVRTLPSGTQGEENIHHVQEKPKAQAKAGLSHARFHGDHSSWYSFLAHYVAQSLVFCHQWRRLVFSPAKRWLTEPDQNSGNLLLGQLDRKPNVEQNVSQNKLIKVCTLHGEERVKKMLGTQKKRANWFWLHRIYCNFILLCTILIENLSPPVSLLLASLVIEDFLSLQCLFRSKNILQQHLLLTRIRLKVHHFVHDDTQVEQTIRGNY